LVIMVTPELVAPMTPDQIPPGGPGLFTDTPTDREFYLYNMLEVPSYGNHCEGQCPPPLPIYEPYHEGGRPHMLPPGGMMQVPPMPPSAYPVEPQHMVPPVPTHPGAPVVPSLPPSPPGPATSSVGFPAKQANASAQSNRPGSVNPTGHTRPVTKTTAKPGLIEPERPSGRP